MTIAASLPPAGSSRVAAISATRKARVYRLARSVPPGTDLVEPESNACADMLERALLAGELPPSLTLEYTSWRDHCARTDAHLKWWASAFISAWDAGELDLPASGMRGATVRRGDYLGMNSREVALSAVLLSGTRGVTVGEARRITGVPGNGPSGALSLLHRVGVLAVREGERR